MEGEKERQCRKEAGRDEGFMEARAADRNQHECRREEDATYYVEGYEKGLLKPGQAHPPELRDSKDAYDQKYEREQGAAQG